MICIIFQLAKPAQLKLQCDIRCDIPGEFRNCQEDNDKIEQVIG